MILLIDNYDSFTYNLAHLIGEIDRDMRIVRNDQITTANALKFKPRAIFISPGPKTPNDAGICLDLLDACATAQIPVFGVCLGMQAIAQSFGGVVSSAGKLMHGKTCNVLHDGTGVFENVPSPFVSTRYHSLAVERENLPDCLEVTASAEDDNEIMAIQHKSLPIAGVQFHPESIASEYGADIVRNFIRYAE